MKSPAHVMTAPTPFGAAARALLSRAEFGDAVMFVYFVAFVRQYFWFVEHDLAAWALTLVAAMLAWALYVRSKPPAVERTPRQFWLIVGLPLFIV